MKKFRIMMDVIVEGDDNITLTDVEDAIDIDLDSTDWDNIEWKVLSGREL